MRGGPVAGGLINLTVLKPPSRRRLNLVSKIQEVTHYRVRGKEDFVW